jgi:hypothetical protein
MNGKIGQTRQTFYAAVLEDGRIVRPTAISRGALNPFFVVLADRHCEGETLTTFFAKIFVKRHRDPPLGLFRNQTL